MYRLLKPKNIHRALIGFILLAPLLYLFGTQIASLAGAHGKDIIKENQEVVVNTRKVDYAQRLNTYSYIYGEFRGITLFRNNGVYNASGTATGYASFNIGGTSLTANHLYYYVTNLSAYDSSKYQVYITIGSTSYYSITNRTVTVTSNTSFRSEIVFYGNTEVQDFTFNSYLFDLTQMYGENASVDDLTRDYDIAGFNAYSLSRIDYFDEYGVPDYRQSLFLDMFGRSNFLTEWGEDALSEDRHGFAPVGQLFKYVDDNMLHLSDKQIGKMAYGYMYYVVHVLIFDIVALAFVFVVTIPQKVLNMINDKTGGDL